MHNQFCLGVEKMNKSSVFNLTNYVKVDDVESLHTSISKLPFFNWVLTNVNGLSDEFLKCVHLNLVDLGKDANLFEQLLLKKLSEEQQVAFTKIQEDSSVANTATYQVLQLFGYSPNQEEHLAETPAECVLRHHSDLLLRRRGIERNDGKFCFNANVFAHYVLSRIAFIQTNDERIYAYSNEGKYEFISDNLFKTICAAIVREVDETIWRKSWESEYMAALKVLIPIVSEFDGDINIINLKNGYFNLDSGKIVPHHSNYISTNQLPIYYDPKAKAPKFKEFLNDVFENDEERYHLIKNIMGYILHKGTPIHKVFIFTGSGSNGKSVLAKILTRLYGEFNVSSTPLNEMEGAFGIQDLDGKLVNIASENESTLKVNTQRLKAITSGDSILINKKHQAPKTKALYVKLILLLNRLFITDDHSNGLYRRLTIIPFYRTYVESRQVLLENQAYMNPNLEKELLEELSGIFNFAYEGYQQLKESNWDLPCCATSESELRKFKVMNDSVGTFVDECLEYANGETILQSDISKRYTAWVDTNSITNFIPLGTASILSNCKEAIQRKNWSVGEKKSNGQKLWVNLRFKT